MSKVKILNQFYSYLSRKMTQMLKVKQTSQSVLFFPSARLQRHIVGRPLATRSVPISKAYPIVRNVQNEKSFYETKTSTSLNFTLDDQDDKYLQDIKNLMKHYPKKQPRIITENEKPYENEILHDSFLLQNILKLMNSGKISLQNNPTFFNSLVHYSVNRIEINPIYVPKLIKYSDYHSPPIILNIEDIPIIFNILIICIREMNLDSIEQTFKISILHGALNLLGIKDPNVQSSGFDLISTLLSQNSSKISQNICSIIRHSFSDIDELEKNHFIIRPYLIILQTLFSPQQKWCNFLSNFFRRYIFHLFLMEDINDFFNDLISFLDFAFQREKRLFSECCCFILKHWPISNSLKSAYYVSFFQKMTHYFSFLPKETLFSIIFKTIKDISSLSFQVSFSTIRFYDSNEILSITQRCNKISELKIRTNIALSHWNDEVRDAANQLNSRVQKISSLEKMTEIKKYNRNQIWNSFSTYL